MLGTGVSPPVSPNTIGTGPGVATRGRPKTSATGGVRASVMALGLRQGHVAQQIFWYSAFTANMVAPRSEGNNTVDDKGVPLIHAVNALLGYDGSGSMLSRRIMAKLGIDEAVFDEISALVRNQDYIVVLTREQHVEVNGLMRALPSMVVDTWDWHRHVPED
jgi:hypothetical protein